jgi:hypothetical protein
MSFERWAVSFDSRSQSKGTELQGRTRVCALMRADTWVRPYKKIVV